MILVLLEHRVHVSSTPGRGSLFAVEAPLGGALPTLVGIEARAETGDAIAGALLAVIDDDETVLAATANLLGGWGCEVVAATTAEAAEARLARLGRTPDLIIADYRLRGGLTGEREIARMSARFGAPIPGIIVTGDTAPKVVRAVEASGCWLLHKPVRPAKLLSLLQYLLVERPVGPTPRRAAPESRRAAS